MASWRRLDGLPSALVRCQRLAVVGFVSLAFLVILGWRGPGVTDRVYYT
jgi:hypothetical protein